MLTPGSSWFGTGTSGVEDGLGAESPCSMGKTLQPSGQIIDFLMTAFVTAKMHFFSINPGAVKPAGQWKSVWEEVQYSGYFLSWSVLLPSRTQFSQCAW